MLMQEWCRLREQIHSKDDITRLSKSDASYTYETLRALLEQLYQRYVLRNFHLIRQHGGEFVRRYRNGKSLISIAEWVGLSPVLVARRVLELTLRSDRRKITRFLRNPGEITDVRLQNDVAQCIQVDDFNGPNVDRVRTVIGVEYEHLLLDYVGNLRLEFETENDLRKRESYKTPDVLLRVPVSFHNTVVCWIDSKAKFADEYTLNKDYSDSVSSYVGRFGPGMVIYWFGFISDCDCPMLHDHGVLVVDHFPKQVQFLPGSQIAQPTDVKVTIID